MLTAIGQSSWEEEVREGSVAESACHPQPRVVNDVAAAPSGGRGRSKTSPSSTSATGGRRYRPAIPSRRKCHGPATSARGCIPIKAAEAAERCTAKQGPRCGRFCLDRKSSLDPRYDTGRESRGGGVRDRVLATTGKQVCDPASQTPPADCRQPNGQGERLFLGARLLYR